MKGMNYFGDSCVSSSLSLSHPAFLTRSLVLPMQHFMQFANNLLPPLILPTVESITQPAQPCPEERSTTFTTPMHSFTL